MQKINFSQEINNQIEPDTIRLLRVCDVGIKMESESIDEILGYIREKTQKKSSQNPLIFGNNAHKYILSRVFTKTIK